MKKRLLLAALPSIALAFTLASCAAPQRWPVPPAPAPTPVPAPTPTPTPQQIPAPTATYANWMDAPRTPGDWFYKAIPPFTYAAYGASDTDFAFVMRCDKANRTVSLGRVSAQGAAQPMLIRTESSERLLTAQPRQGSIETLLAVDLSADDALLDAMAISKGRFAVEVRGEATLYVPSWPEVTRVIEDCR